MKTKVYQVLMNSIVKLYFTLENVNSVNRFVTSRSIGLIPEVELKTIYVCDSSPHLILGIIDAKHGSSVIVMT